MKAILFEAPRKIRLIDDMPVPEPEEGEVLVRCTHLGLCGGNVGPYTGQGHWAKIDWPAPLGWQGHESVGIVVESRDDDWPVGTPVLAQDKRFNGFVEYIVPSARSLNRLPPDADDVGRLVLAQPLATVMRALAATRPVIGERCAVVGQGPIGLMFTYLLNRFGASEVIAADVVPWRLEWARRLGARHVDESEEQFLVFLGNLEAFVEYIHPEVGPFYIRDYAKWDLLQPVQGHPGLCECDSPGPVEFCGNRELLADAQDEEIRKPEEAFFLLRFLLSFLFGLFIFLFVIFKEIDYEAGESKYCGEN